MEEWREIVDTDKWYDVSNKGNVRSWKCRKLGANPRILKQQLDMLGRPTVGIFYGKIQKKRIVSQIVAEAFIGKRPFNMVLCHNDGNPQKNFVENLRYDTMKNNMLDKRLHGTMYCGEKHFKSKLNNSQIRTIRDLCDRRVKNKEIAKIAGIHPSLVSHIKHRKRWAHVV